MKNRLSAMLGLARRAGKLDAGFDQVVGDARSKNAALLLAASDISEKTYKNLCYEANKAGVRAHRIELTQEEISRACKTKAGVLALKDEGFAKAVLDLIEAMRQY